MTAAFRCPECGGNVRPFAGPGRALKHRGVPVSVPADLEVNTCDKCGEEYFGPEDVARVDAAMEVAYRDELTKRAAAALRKIIDASIEQSAVETLLGLSAGYLSKVKTGARVPSADLVSHLALIAKSPKSRIGELVAFWRTPLEFKPKRGSKPKALPPQRKTSTREARPRR